MTPEIGKFAGSPGYFVHGQWTVDMNMNSLAVGKIVAVDNSGVTLEFAAGNTVTLGTGLLYPPQQWEVDSWHRMRGQNA